MIGPGEYAPCIVYDFTPPYFNCHLLHRSLFGFNEDNSRTDKRFGRQSEFDRSEVG